MYKQIHAQKPESKNEQAFLPIGLPSQVLCLSSNPKQYQEYNILDWLIPSHVQTEVSVW